jgi:probable dihydroxyacetone kinase regulator
MSLLPEKRGYWNMSDSLITKKAIALGMKELTKKKSFDKITVQDITEICGLNRQTFYYHFQDKYELVDWIYYNEAISLIVNDLTFDNWDKKLLEMLTKMKEEDYFYENTLKASLENEFKEYLYQVASELFCDIIDRIAERDIKDSIDGEIREDSKRFFSKFFAYGIVGIIISWAQNGMKESPQYVASHLKSLSEGAKKLAVSRYLQEAANPEG